MVLISGSAYVVVGLLIFELTFSMCSRARARAMPWRLGLVRCDCVRV
jgi:hypothetical protein